MSTEGDEYHEENDNISDLSEELDPVELFESDEHLLNFAIDETTGKTVAVKMLSLDEVPFDRDIKYINVAQGARIKPKLVQENGATLLKQMNAITSHKKDLVLLDEHYKNLDRLKKNFESRAQKSQSTSREGKRERKRGGKRGKDKDPKSSDKTERSQKEGKIPLKQPSKIVSNPTPSMAQSPQSERDRFPQRHQTEHLPRNHDQDHQRRDFRDFQFQQHHRPYLEQHIPHQMHANQHSDLERNHYPIQPERPNYSRNHQFPAQSNQPPNNYSTKGFYTSRDSSRNHDYDYPGFRHGGPYGVTPPPHVMNGSFGENNSDKYNSRYQQHGDYLQQNESVQDAGSSNSSTRLETPQLPMFEKDYDAFTDATALRVTAKEFVPSYLK